MSYTAIKAIWPGEKTETLEELRNSHGSAPPIWNSMCKEYYGTKDHGYMFDGILDKLWPRWMDLSIPEHQRAVLMFTYDKAYVTKENYGRLSNDIEKFFSDFPPIHNHVNHWPRIVEILKSNPDIPAIGLYCTSVSEDPFQGAWNEEKDDYDPPDWDQCFDIYEQLDNLLTKSEVTA
jgi:hypothetical protein